MPLGLALRTLVLVALFLLSCAGSLVRQVAIPGHAPIEVEVSAEEAGLIDGMVAAQPDPVSHAICRYWEQRAREIPKEYPGAYTYARELADIYCGQMWAF